jgi:hypothetical protein
VGATGDSQRYQFGGGAFLLFFLVFSFSAAEISCIFPPKTAKPATRRRWLLFLDEWDDEDLASNE